MKGMCEVCGRKGRVHRNKKTGKILCPKCYQKLAAPELPKKRCFFCGELRRVYCWLDETKAMCKSCWRRSPYYPKKKCSKCGKIGIVEKRHPKTKRLLCESCFRRITGYHYQPKEKICSFCRELKPVEYRTQDGEPLCRRCYKREIWRPRKKQKVQAP